MDQRRTLVTLIALAVAATFAWLLWPWLVPVPEQGALPDPAAGAAAPDAQGGALPADAAADAETAERERAGGGEAERRTYVVTGRVLAVRSHPFTGARVVAHRGAPEDRAGAAALFSMFGSGLSGSKPPSPQPLTQTPIVTSADVATDGTFALAAGERHLRLELDHDFYGLTQPFAVHVPEDAKRAQVVLEPFLGAFVVGRVVGEPEAVRSIASVRIALAFDPLAMMQDPGGAVATMLGNAREHATVAADATFTFRAVPASCDALLLGRSDLAFARATARALQPGERREVALPARAAGEIEVVALRDSGEPVAGANAGALPLDEKDQMHRAVAEVHARTDDDGTARLRGLPAGKWRVHAHATGLVGAEQELDLAPGERRTVRLTLSAGASVAGVVVDPDDRPVAGARVGSFPSMKLPLVGDSTEQLGLDLLTLSAARGARTDESGRFELTGLEQDAELHVVAAHDEFAGGVARGVRAGDRDVRVALQRAATITGRVTAGEGGAPVEGAIVEAQVTMFLVVKRTATTAVTGAEGTFRLSVPSGSYTLVARAEGFAEATRSASVRGGETRDAGELALARGCTVRGVVRAPDGTPVRGALVRRKQGGMQDNAVLSQMFGGGAASTRADEQGRFELVDLPPGRVLLIATAEGFATGRSERLQLEAGAVLENVVVELGGGGTIAGKLLVEAGDRADEFTVLVKTLETQDTRSVVPAHDGTFRATALDPGQYEVQAMHPHALEAMERSQLDWRPGKPMDLGEIMRAVTDSVVMERCVVRAGETTEVTLDASSLGAGSRLTLDVRVGDRPLAEGVVELTADGGMVRSGFVQDGKTTFGGMKPGSLRVQVRGGLGLAPIGEPQQLAFPADTAHHRAELRLPGGALRGRVVDDRTGEPLATALVRLLHGADAQKDDTIGIALTNAAGEFRFDGLADGDYGVAADDSLSRPGEGGASRLSGVRVAAGAPAVQVELRSRPAAVVTVTVTGPNGAPLAGAFALCVDGEGRQLGGIPLAITGPDGKATFGGLPRGAARVVGRAPGFAPGASDLQELEEGRAAEFALRLAAGSRTAVHAAAADGTPLAGAVLAARRNGGPWIPALLLVERAPAAGQFELGRLEPGDWELRVTHPSTGTFTLRRRVEGAATTILATPGR